MKKRIARLLRRGADRLDPPPVCSWSISPTTITTSNLATNSITFTQLGNR